MKTISCAAACGLWLGCLMIAAAEEPPMKASLRLIVAPHAGGAALYTVEIDKPGSQATSVGLNRPLFPNWRPSGGSLVFTSNASGHFQIYAVPTSGGAAVNLTNTSTVEEQPACSPDGMKVLFTSNRDGNQEIYVMDSDGKNQVNLTRNPGFDSDATWSPDGERIAFASDRSGKGFHLMVMNADGSEPRNVIEKNLGGMLYPCWSPDGQQIAFSALAQPDLLRLYVINADGSGMQALTDGSGMDCYPAWSPDGRWLAFVHFAKHPSQCPDGGRVLLLDLEEGTTRELAGAPSVTASRMAWFTDD